MKTPPPRADLCKLAKNASKALFKKRVNELVAILNSNIDLVITKCERAAEKGSVHCIISLAVPWLVKKYVPYTIIIPSVSTYTTKDFDIVDDTIPVCVYFGDDTSKEKELNRKHRGVDSSPIPLELEEAVHAEFKE